jgi:hypothetical protein
MLNVVNRVPRIIRVPKRGEEGGCVKILHNEKIRSFKIRTIRKTLLRYRNYKVWSKNVKCTRRNKLGISQAVANSTKVDFHYIRCEDECCKSGSRLRNSRKRLEISAKQTSSSQTYFRDIISPILNKICQQQLLLKPDKSKRHFTRISSLWALMIVSCWIFIGVKRASIQS